MNTQIDFSSKTPYHVQAEHILRQMINTEKYRSGAILPNEVELAQELKYRAIPSDRPSTGW